MNYQKENRRYCQIIDFVGHSRNGWGKGAKGESHLMKLDCGNTQFVPASQYKGMSSFILCKTCSEAAEQYRPANTAITETEASSGGE